MAYVPPYPIAFSVSPYAPTYPIIFGTSTVSGTVDPRGRALPAVVTIYSGLTLLAEVDTDMGGAWSVTGPWGGLVRVVATIGAESVESAAVAGSGSPVTLAFPAPAQPPAPEFGPAFPVAATPGGRSLMINPDTWDLMLDGNGCIAVAVGPYAVAQDVACACRTFRGDVYYRQGDGIPYFDDVLGHAPPLSLVTSHMERAALSVLGVVSAQAYIARAGRDITGEMRFVDAEGVARGVQL